MTVKEKLGDKILVATVGSITSSKQANELLRKGFDVAVAGRVFLKNPGFIWSWGEELGVEINVTNQIRWGFGGRPGFQQKALNTVGSAGQKLDLLLDTWIACYWLDTIEFSSLAKYLSQTYSLWCSAGIMLSIQDTTYP